MSDTYDGQERRAGHDHLLPVLLERVDAMRGDLRETKDTVQTLDRSLRGSNGNPGFFTKVELLDHRIDNIEVASRTSGAKWGSGAAIIVSVVIESVARLFGLKGPGNP